MNLREVKREILAVDALPFEVTSESDLQKGRAGVMLRANEPTSTIAEFQVSITIARCEPANLTRINELNERFREQSVTWFSLNNRNIISVLGLCITANGLPGIVTRHYANGKISSYVEAHPSVNIHKLIMDLASGVGYLHEKGFCHNDLCPSNALITDDGDACVSPPGLSRVLCVGTAGGRVKIPYTWAYKAPEELLPQGDINPTREMDVYAFGSTVYEILTGRPPYRCERYRSTLGVVRILRHGHITLPKPSDIDTAVWSVIQKCWARDPNARPTMHEVKAELQVAFST